MKTCTVSCASALMMLLVATSVQAQSYGIGGKTYIPTLQTETVGATFTQPDGGVTTGSYFGFVRLVVSGSGVSCTPATNDAFYIYQWQVGCGNPNVVPQHDPNYYQLTFDTETLVPLATSRDATRFIYYDIDAGTEVPSRPYVPAYRPDHTYSFIVNTGLTTAGRLHFGVSDGGFGDNSGAYQIQVTQLQEVLSSLPDLLPSTSAGWPTPIVISRIAGGHTDGPLYVGDALYVDGVYRNAGFSGTPPFQITWYVDGAPAASSAAPALAAGTSFHIDDVRLGPLTVGLHTVKMVLDSGGAVTEFDETNNEYTRDVWVRARPGTPGDFDGDDKSDVTVFRPSTGDWYIRQSGSLTSLVYSWGGGGDIPVPGDYDGDGKTDVAVFRPSTGAWYIIKSSTMMGTGVTWGGGGDIPVPGDYDGDGMTDVAVFRPSTGAWYTIKSSTMMGAGVTWGGGGDIPVPGDYDGDGMTDVAVFRPSTGAWYIIKSSTMMGVAITWGGGGDIPVASDYDGDGRADVAVFRPSTGAWYIIKSSTMMGASVTWGGAGDIPVSGDYDGDGQTDIAVFRPVTGGWYVIQSTTLTGTVITWGGAGDIPIIKRP